MRHSRYFDEMKRFVTDRLDEIELWAVEASRHGHGSHTVPVDGSRWHWTDSNYNPVDPNPADGPVLTDGDMGYEFNLRSVEEYPLRSIPGTHPMSITNYANEIHTAAAGHIIRHDPWHVLRDTAAKRKILAELFHGPAMSTLFNAFSDTVLIHLASPYRHHPDYKEYWPS